MPLPPTERTIWDRVAKSEEFKDVMAAKARFIVPATLFFVACYFALPLLVGYAPTMMSRVDSDAERRFVELEVRANTGLGAVKAS